MNTKIVIAATVAALSLATTAFAGEGSGTPTPSVTYAVSATSPARDTGSAQYQATNPAEYNVRFDNTTLPVNGSEGPVQSANSLPRGFENGTAAYMTAQSVDRWYAQQADHRFAAAQLANGRRS